ncbi:MAG: VWA domain-containing protein [Chloroflexota bacterium]
MPWAPPSRPSAFSPAHELLRSLGGATRRDLVDNVLAFCRALRNEIPNVTSGRVLDAVRSIALIDIGNPQDFRTALRSNLVSAQEDLPIFDTLFALFWRPLDLGAQNRPPDADGTGEEGLQFDLPLTADIDRQIARMLQQEAGDEASGDEEKGEGDALAYSAVEALGRKDFEDFNSEEIKLMRRVLQRLAPKLATGLSRRTTASFRGTAIDLRRSFRRNLKYGGDPVILAHKRKKVHKLHLALLCDVSGSMDRYSRFLLQFIYGLQNQMTGINAWVFSTRLTEVTSYLKGNSYERSLEEIAASVHDWSGGTTIGSCLYDFVRGPGRRRIDRRTVVIVISDGWDRGDVTRLSDAMRQMKQQAHKIIWLNPLLGNPQYQPLCAGIRAALPYTDYFLPAHNLDSLIKLTRTLEVLGRNL